MELLRQEKLEIDQQLRSMHGGSTMGSMQNLPMSRRNDRGYNSDMDGSGGGRLRGSSMRGRGGRGRGSGRQNDSRYNSGSNTITDYVNNVDKSRKMMGPNGRGRMPPTSNGRPPRGGTGGERRDRPNRGRASSIDTAAGGDREHK